MINCAAAMATTSCAVVLARTSSMGVKATTSSAVDRLLITSGYLPAKTPLLITNHCAVIGSSAKPISRSACASRVMTCCCLILHSTYAQ